MTRWNLTAGLFIVAALLLLTNPLWLFPNEDERRYTYERVPITVEDGTITYDVPRCQSPCDQVSHRYNDLNAVDCQPRDPRYGSNVDRGCLFDEYLVTHGPVRVAERDGAPAEPDFVELDDTYYRRVSHPNNDSTVTVDVEQVAPRDLLATVAENVTADEPYDPSVLQYETRLVLTGGTTTTFREPDDRHLGNVYYRNGTYYTVVGVGSTTINYVPGPLRRTQRLMMMAVGALLQIGVAIFFFYDGVVE